MGYSDASERAEQSRCDSIYARAVAAENKNDFKTAIELYSEIKAYKDSQDRIAKVQIKKNASDKKRKTVLAMIAVSVCVILLHIVFVFVPAGKNSKARELLAEGKYDEAVAIFRETGSTKGIRSVAEAYVTLDEYDNAVVLYKCIYDKEGIQAMLDLANKSFAEENYANAAALYVSIYDENGIRSIADLANTRLANKEYAKALELYTSINDIDGVRAVARAYLANKRLRQGYGSV